MSDKLSIYDPTNKSDNPAVTVTAKAIAYVKKEIQEHKAIGFRIGVKKSGCSGLKYVVDYVYEKKQDDQVFPIENELTVFVDKKSLPAIYGITVDYIRVGLNGVLKFINPNEKESCGCGESFTVD